MKSVWQEAPLPKFEKLKRNKAEYSWDCPCHGSRFSEEGIVIDNPSNGNLGKK